MVGGAHGCFLSGGRAQAGKEGGQVPGGDLGKDLVLEEEAPADRLRGKESVRWT